MALFCNKSGKPIGDVSFVILPGELKDLPEGIEKHPTIAHYLETGQLVMSGAPKQAVKSPTNQTPSTTGGNTSTEKAKGKDTGKAKGKSKGKDKPNEIKNGNNDGAQGNEGEGSTDNVD